MGRERDGVGAWRADAHQCDQVPSADEESRNTLEVTGGQGEAWSNSTQAPEKRESAPKGKVQSITDAKFPVYCSNRGRAGPSEKVATPAMECEVGMLKGRRIVSNELKTTR